MRKLFLPLIFLLLLPAAVLFGQEAPWYQNKPIADIEFSGLENVSVNEIKGVIKGYIGKPFTDDLYWELQNKLYALDLFESFSGEALEGEKGDSEVVIRFTVTEKPLVDEIVLQGNSIVRDVEILEVVLSKRDDVLSRTKVRSDEEAVRALYREKGFNDAVLSAEIEEIEDQNRVRIVFDINEGAQTRISAFLFSGNEFAADKTLKAQLESKQESFFSSGIFKEADLQKDIENIESYYYERGYVDARVRDVKRESDPEKQEEGRNYITVTFFIEEGEQWSYGGITFEGNLLFSDEELRAVAKLEKGKLLNRNLAEADFMRINDLYYNEGYIFNSIERDEIRDEENNTISYQVRIVERGRAHIESITIKGNEKTAEEVIRREIPLEVGDVFSKQKIMDGLGNLYNTQYFDSVIPETPQGSEAGLMDLVINVEEARTTDIQFGMTFTSQAGALPIVGFLKWNDRNFRGMGQDLSIGLELSPNKQSLEFSFDENWLFGKRFNGGVEFSISHKLNEEVPQDIMGPIFFEDSDDNPQVVPDPYDGHWVDADTGVAVANPSQAQIDNGEVLTDYAYALANEQSIPESYLMDYETFEFSLGGNGGYTFHTPIGRFGVGGGLSTGLSYTYYDASIYRPYDKDIRDELDKWLLINRLWVSGSYDTRDLVYAPNKGFFIKQAFTYTGGFLFGARDYIRSSTSGEIHQKLIDIEYGDDSNFKLVGSLKSKFSFVLPQFYYESETGSWQWGTNTTREDLFYTDGMIIAKGWPISYDGEALWDSSLDLRTPISEGSLSWNSFLSATALLPEMENLKSIGLDNFKFSLGTGLQIDIPSFPIGFYLVKRFQFADETFGSFEWLPGELFYDPNTPDSGLQFVITFNLNYF